MPFSPVQSAYKISKFLENINLCATDILESIHLRATDFLESILLVVLQNSLKAFIFVLQIFWKKIPFVHL